MDMLPLSYMDQRFADVLNAQAFKVVPEPVARNSRPYDARPTCCGNNNCMPICPIAAMYNGITHAEKAEQAGAKLIAQAVVYKIESDDNRPDHRGPLQGPERQQHACHGQALRARG
jgi:hypothetical protein